MGSEMCIRDSLLRRFTLTGSKPAVCSLWHFPAGHPGWALPTTLLYGARTFLDNSPLPRSPGWLVRPLILRISRHHRHKKGSDGLSGTHQDAIAFLASHHFIVTSCLVSAQVSGIGGNAASLAYPVHQLCAPHTGALAQQFV